jgi:stearoyl-CoA desaturase (delta-9 desaturase)
MWDMNSRALRVLTWFAVSLTLYSVITDFQPMMLIASFVAFEVYWCIGFSAALHRYFCHRSFKTTRFWEEVLFTVTMCSVMNNPGLYTFLHQAHHKYSDTEKDPYLFHYGKQLFSFTTRYKGSQLTRAQLRQLAKDPYSKRASKYGLLYPLGYMSILALIDFDLLVYVWAIPVIAVQWARLFIGIKAIHWFGYQTYDTGDKSTNSKLLAILFGGEGLHNTHHKYPGRWNLSNSKWELDPVAWFIRLIKIKE